MRKENEVINEILDFAHSEDNVTVNYKEMWQSLFHSGKFIRKIGIELAEKLQFTYPMRDDMNVTKYIQKIKTLPRDSTDFITN